MQWTEKYRPKCISDIVGQQDTVTIISKMASNGGLPNLLFYGPPGTGKTTLARVIAQQELGEDISHNFTELNASDDGTNKLRNTCLQAVRFMPFTPSKQRIILLDEADRLAPSTQDVLRKPFENRGRTIFILTANDAEKLSKALRSRVTNFEFKPLTPKNIQARLKKVCRAENITLPEKVIRSISVESKGDIRHAINELQKEAMLI